MLSSVEQAFVGWDEKRAPLKTPAWEANTEGTIKIVHVNGVSVLSGLNVEKR